ncbi:hypothetical protein IAT38_001847 [Cryptococcus sp. DSM 104549]
MTAMINGRKPTHAVFVLHPMWGHIRPLLNLAHNLLILHPLLSITLLVPPAAVSNASAELATLAASSADEAQEGGNPPQERLQVLTCAKEDAELPAGFKTEGMTVEGKAYAAVLPLFLEGLWEGRQEVVQGVSNKFAGVEIDLVIYDIFQTFVNDTIRSVATSLGRALPTLIASFSCSVAAIFHMFASEDRGGSFAKMHRLAKEDIDRGINAIHAYGKHAYVAYGDAKTLPGLPTKFDCQYTDILLQGL